MALAIFLLSSTLELSAQSITESKSLVWYQDYDTAKKDAMTNGKYMMLYFSGLDWCKTCIKLNQNVLETDTFSKYATGKFVPLRLDFPKMKKKRPSKQAVDQNEALAEKYNPNGVFPLLVFVDKNEKMIGFTGFSELSAQAYVAMIEKIIHQ
jgi:thioredoxin-related protein